MAMTKTIHPDKLGPTKALDTVTAGASRTTGVIRGFDLLSKKSQAVLSPGAVKINGGIKVVDSQTTITIPQDKASIIYFSDNKNALTTKEIPYLTYTDIYTGLTLLDLDLATTQEIPLYIARDYNGVIVFDDVRKFTGFDGVNFIKSVVPGVLSYHTPTLNELVMLGDGTQYYGTAAREWKPLHNPVKAETKYDSLTLIKGEGTSLSDYKKPATCSRIDRHDGTVSYVFRADISEVNIYESGEQTQARVSLTNSMLLSGRVTIAQPGKQTHALYGVHDGKYLNLFSAASGIPVSWGMIFDNSNFAPEGTTISGYLGV